MRGGKAGYEFGCFLWVGGGGINESGRSAGAFSGRGGRKCRNRFGGPDEGDINIECLGLRDTKRAKVLPRRKWRA
ncbi:hypothetical protein L596_008498 [Steinernema carpocapsae]|uniref:Uncharacterized protein n=1 Tax=Steinernema carpocapsae TaxID=34508 RepID=A0A4U5PCN9_STECR|nr:hypothetical protein L596_008498 [Steinernema carpocapsae]